MILTREGDTISLLSRRAVRIIESIMRTKIAWLAALNCMLCTASALAVLQPTPGGDPIPVLNANVTACDNFLEQQNAHPGNAQLCLDIAEGATGSIDAQADALVAPETFRPACALTF